MGVGEVEALGVDVARVGQDPDAVDACRAQHGLHVEAEAVGGHDHLDRATLGPPRTEGRVERVVGQGVAEELVLGGLEELALTDQALPRADLPALELQVDVPPGLRSEGVEQSFGDVLGRDRPVEVDDERAYEVGGRHHAAGA